MWKRLRHQNIVPFIGVTQDPLQFVSEWMPNGTLTEYLNHNPSADRVDLVSFSLVYCFASPISFQAIGHSRRSGLSSCRTHNTRRFERGRCPLPLSAIFIHTNELLLAQHPHRP